MYLTIKQFQGTVPAKSETLLASQYAQAALNTKITPNVIHPIFEDADLFAAYDIDTEEELKTLKQERKDLDTLFYGKDNPEENS